MEKFIKESMKKLIHVVTNEEIFKNINGSSFYLGIDPTASNLHIGHLLPIMLAKKLVTLGAKPILLVGNFTGQIGDPSGKTEVRTMMNEDNIKINSQGIFNEIKQILGDVLIVYNGDWLNKMSLLDYLKYAYHFSVSKKIHLDIFGNRLDNHNPVCMAEFIYPDLQALDFLYLKENYNCTIQIGGGDQWGNISFGTSFVKKYTGDDNIFGICTPLLLTNEGKKMGKSEKGAILLKNSLDIWNFLLNIKDDEALQMAEMFESKVFEDPRETKEKLAEYIMEIFEKGGFDKFKKNQKKVVEMESNFISKIIFSLNFTESIGEAKRLIGQGAIRINDKIIEVDEILTAGDYDINCGKKYSISIKILNH